LEESRVETLHHRSPEVAKCETPKSRSTCQRLHFGVSDTRSWRSQESRLFITGVPKLRNAKRRNTLIKTPFQSFGYRELEVSRTLTTRVPKLRNAKRRNPETGTSTKTPFQSFGYRELEESRVETLHHRSPEVAKCETPKYVDLTPFRSFGYRELEESRVETLHHRSPEVAKCETPIISGFVTWSVEILLHRNAEM
jgi:hypothetical protein